MNNMWILAAADGEGEVITSEAAEQTEQITTTQTDGSNGGAETPLTEDVKPNPLFQYGPLVIIFVVMYFLMFRGPKKKQQKHKEMVSALAKNARVRTIGGIFGTVLDVRDDEIVIKIDESNNTKMRISPSAVATVLSDDNNK